MELQMLKCKVSSGEFELVLTSSSLLDAAKQAIRLHDLKQLSSKLGDLFLVEELDGDDKSIDHAFIATQGLIEKYTLEGYGVGLGQYQRDDCHQDDDSAILKFN